MRPILNPADQQRRRRRARITQGQIAEILHISIGKVSEYETGRKPTLPYELTPEDYEAALNQLMRKPVR